MDWEEIEGLLHIVEKAHQWPQLHALRDAAMAKLVDHVGVYKKHVEETPKPEAEEKAEELMKEEPNSDADQPSLLDRRL